MSNKRHLTRDILFHMPLAFWLDCKCLTGNAGEFPNDQLIGDGYCQDEINNERCNYDGGDCCGPCINKRYCTNCTCLKNDTQIKFPNPVIGDGACNSEMDNVKCSYDFGDCCPKFYLVGDGFCNDETNNPRLCGDTCRI